MTPGERFRTFEALLRRRASSPEELHDRLMPALDPGISWSLIRHALMMNKAWFETVDEYDQWCELEQIYEEQGDSRLKLAVLLELYRKALSL